MAGSPGELPACHRRSRRLASNLSCVCLSSSGICPISASGARRRVDVAYVPFPHESPPQLRKVVHPIFWAAMPITSFAVKSPSTVPEPGTPGLPPAAAEEIRDCVR